MTTISRGKLLRDRFVNDYPSRYSASVLVVAVKLPNEAIETITNSHNIPSKMDYYMSAYDGAFRLQNNPEIQIVGYLLV